MKFIQIVTILGMGVLTLPSNAATNAVHDMGNMEMSSEEVGAPSVTSTEAVEGEVRQVNKAQGKVTLRHASIKNLDMPAMTMAYKVQDISMLDNLSTGDKVIFTADQIKGGVVVTTISKVPLVNSK